MIIVAESGATKTDWRLLMDDGTVRNASSAGLNPSVLGPDQINSIIGSVIPELNPEGRSVREIHFYGAGLVNEAAAAPLAEVLDMWCPFSDKHFHSDMLAAARALFGDGSGIVAIMVPAQTAASISMVKSCRISVPVDMSSEMRAAAWLWERLFSQIL
jgi:N-acetylglucosamine kinase-like BadF-type ATPase